MSIYSPRSSVFTFESRTHCLNVLGRLDEQRHGDRLCDITVEVDGQSFRAHRAVLTACSEYFANVISKYARQGAVLTLPPEVTAAGFEPLLKFAYTSKLLFSKQDVLEVRSAASTLGFRDLDKTCFDFLLPKFFNSGVLVYVPICDVCVRSFVNHACACVCRCTSSLLGSSQGC
uniref:BTB domain-containing protein n=1 Tax=Gadus morhua TaxID=8049 RepID=A0A8C5FBS4_GADMO